MEDIRKALAENKPYVIRLRSEGDISREVIVDDLFKGTISQREIIRTL
jgi:hypothetical protein